MASALSQAKKLAAYNNKLEQSNVKLQYTYNKSLADQDRSFQERMANSAHQREIKDLKAAGLNPVLSVTGGNGAVTPSGSSTSVSKANVDMSLPKAVMDMAMAQLNSATSLQTTAMMNATTLENTRMQGLNQLAAIGNQAVVDAILKGIPSGDSKYGQYQAFRNNLIEKTQERFPNAYNRLFDAKDKFNTLFPYNIFNDQSSSFRGVPLLSVSPYTTDEFIKSNKGGRNSYTDIDKVIADLAKDDNSANKYEKKANRQKRWKNRKEEFKSNFTALRDGYYYFKDKYQKKKKKK